MPSLFAKSARLPWWPLTNCCSAARSMVLRAPGARVKPFRLTAVSVMPASQACGSDTRPGRRAPSRRQGLLDMAGFDRVAIAQQRRAFQQVAQFPDIARVILRLQQAQCGLADVQLALRGHALQQGGCQQDDVVPSLAQGGQVNRKRAQAVVQVFTKQLLRTPCGPGRGGWPTPRGCRHGAARCCPRGGRCRFPAGAAA